ncbi:MAG: replication-associated recombination protein A [candidate division WOR-3 bacterium]
MNLFTDKNQFSKPLADRMRPKSLDEILGQDHLLAKGKPLRTLLEKGELYSMIFWGPPGSGKTTLALLCAQSSNAHFVAFSAVTSGVAEIRNVIKQAEYQQRFHNKRTILFVDEIHRFNKAQQDAFLPYVESGKIILIGATTENPSFEVIGPLLSRTKVYVLKPLTKNDLKKIMKRALTAEDGLKPFNPVISEKALEYIATISDGDARRALNTLELAVMATDPNSKNQRQITLAIVEDVVQRKFLLYDKSGEEHYNLISALHKCLRDSDPDAALYWLARMLEAGEDPLYIARRLVRFASEDIGNADPQALVVANAAKEAVDFIGMPEGNTALAQACIYLALAPKSNAVYKAYESAKKDALETMAEPVPLHLRNPVTPLMKQLGYGKGYKYAHNYPGAKVNQEHFPKSLKGRKYYFPTNRGWEAKLKNEE